MSSGYLFIQTNAEFPDRVRCLQQTDEPEPSAEDAGGSTRYIARFANIFRGHQQFQGLLSKHLIDIDQGLYKVSLLDAIATIETCALTSERIWIDPALDSDTLQQLDNNIELFKANRLKRDKLWKSIGFGSLLLFAIMLMFVMLKLNGG